MADGGYSFVLLRFLRLLHPLWAIAGTSADTAVGVTTEAGRSIAINALAAEGKVK